MSEYVKKFIRLFTGSNPVTWAGHALQGFVLGYLAFLAGHPDLGYLVTMSIFLHREISDLVMPWVRGELTWQETWSKFREDGIFDLITPHIGYGAGAAMGALTLFLL